MMFPPNGANRGRYANTEVDRLIDFARREVDSGETKGRVSEYSADRR